jgi:hypothetical protein
VIGSPIGLVLGQIEARGRPARPSGKDKWTACCPAHDDRTPSLSITIGADDQVLIYCHAGCTMEAVVAALNLSPGDLFVERDIPAARHRRTPVATYHYTDEDGVLLFEKRRYEPKGFDQRRPDGKGGWVWKLDGTRKVLYNLPGVVRAVAAGATVYITEGEKDADALQAVLSGDDVATTPASGAGSWLPEYSEQLRGGITVVWADADAPGRHHAREVTAALEGVCAQARAVESPYGKDAHDHFEKGYDLEDLRDLADDQPDADDPLLDDLGVWAFTDLGPILDGNYELPVPTILHTDDGARAFFYAGRVNSIHGDSGVGKSWIALAAIAQILTAGGWAILVDYEGTAAEAVARLRALGVPVDAIRERFGYVQPASRADEVTMSRLVAGICEGTALVVFDSLGEAFGVEGIDENSDFQVAPWIRNVPRRVSELGPAVLLVDHITKTAENARFASGSKRKRAAITGASYLVKVATTPPTRECAGTLSLICAKDRHGSYAADTNVATIEITPHPDGAITVSLHPPMAGSTGAAGATSDEVAAVALFCLREENPAGISKNALATLMKDEIKTSRANLFGGIDLAIGRGHIIVDAGPGRSQLHRLPDVVVAPGVSASSSGWF